MEPAPETQPRRRGRPPSGVRDAILAATLELIHEGGLSQATTRNIAERAGASEASIHYHFGGKAGLLEAVVVGALEPLQDLAPGQMAGRSAAEELAQLMATIERFFDQIVPVVSAVQGDAALRRTFNERLAAHDRGPHAGVRLVERYLRAAREEGLVPEETDLRATALMLVGACMLRAWQKRLLVPAQRRSLPSLERAVATILGSSPASPPGGAA
jgi:AcrR family transcriptional regulator